MALDISNDPELAELFGAAPGQTYPPAPVGVLPAGAGGVNAMVGGAYDGADRFDRQIAMWSPSTGSADSDILPNKLTLDSRARDTFRNDAYLASGSNIHKDNIVGGMFMLNSKPEYKLLGLDEVWAQEYQEEVETKFGLIAESPNHWLDASRMNTFTSMIRLAVGIYSMCGEVVSTAEWMGRTGGRPCGTAIQMIDVDRLSTPPEFMDDRDVRGGIRRDSYGAPQGAYFRKAHQSDWMNPDAFDWKYVSMRKKWGRMQVIHILEQFRPDQSRGIAEMVSALKESRITKKFRDVVLQNAVVNATYAASIESDLPPEAAFQALGGGNVSEDRIAAAIATYAGGYLSAINAYSGSSKNMQIDGVKIPHLFPGTKLQMRPAGNGGPLGTDFEKSLLRYIASSLGISYEQLSRDYSQTNYSSARAAMTETWKYMQSRKRMVADRFATMIYMLWLEEAIESGEITSLSKRKAPNWRDHMIAEAYSSCEWIGASRGQIDELKETQAAILRIERGLSTYEDELGRLGKDFRKVFAQKAREKALADSYKLELSPASNQMNASTGAIRDKSQPRSDSELRQFIETIVEDMNA
jgi:lambda family phage portal protein